MAGGFEREPMLELFIYESEQLIEEMEKIILESEKHSSFSEDAINEIFRAMHTIKGSAGMMLYTGIASIAHSIEDLFFVIREEKATNYDIAKVIDVVLAGIDFIKTELYKIQNNMEVNGNSSQLVDLVKELLTELKIPGKSGNKENKTKNDEASKYYIPSKLEFDSSNYYKATIFFENDVGMENIRAFGLLHQVKEKGEILIHVPEDLFNDNEACSKEIAENGFRLYIGSELGVTEMRDVLMETVFLKELNLEVVEKSDIPQKTEQPSQSIKEEKAETDQQDTPANLTQKQNFISVNVEKLDTLMNLVGELVISESMVTRNPEVLAMGIESFYKAARQLRKITEELQDTVMSMRMVPLTNTFQKMNRVVRDMVRKLNKEATLEIIGEETEVDKNIIEHIGDPLMHLIRNAMDHGMEEPDEREFKGKPRTGKVTLEAKNAGGDVWITVRDDGKGLDREKILRKAESLGMLKKHESEMSDKEVFAFILEAGFSTKDEVSVFSGRGVGMDVVVNNIQSVGGSIMIESEKDKGTLISIRIPLTLAIIDGMVITVGESSYIVPTVNIKVSFRANEKDIITDNEGNEMILIRGVCYPIMRLHRIYDIPEAIQTLSEGIILMVDDDAGGLCIFADVLVGEQQVVVKPLPKYIKKVKGIGGCTLLGDGSISLILDIATILKNSEERSGETNG